MATYGFGANYSGTDMTENFITNGVVCIGWSKREAPTSHIILREIKIGDIVYLKSNQPGGYPTIKAIGVVTSNRVRKYEELGDGIKVKWVVTELNKYMSKCDKRYNIRANTIYEEKDDKLIRYVVKQLLKQVRTNNVDTR